jgi:hypothetical protein
MAAICHGNGNLESEGCCWVDGAICPNRWKLVDGHVFDAAGNDLGTVQEIIATVTNNKRAQERGVELTQGVTFLCGVAMKVLLADTRLIGNPTGFRAAWLAHADYQPIADAWERIGRPREYCPTFGPAEGQCCFAEPLAVNEAKQATLSEVAVQVRTGNRS